MAATAGRGLAWRGTAGQQRLGRARRGWARRGWAWQASDGTHNTTTAAAPTSPYVVEQPAPITPGPGRRGPGWWATNATTTTTSKEHTK